MTGKERMRAAHLGHAVDRAPIWLREGFEMDGRTADPDDFLNGWRADPVYRDTCEYVAPHIDLIRGWGVGHMNRFLMIPPGSYVWGERVVRGDDMFSEGAIRTPRGDLLFRVHWKQNSNNGWMDRHPVQSLDDLKKVAEIPWTLDRATIETAFAENYPAACRELGERGVLRFNFSSPIVIISGLMDLQLFLELSYVHRDTMHELLKDITRRLMDVAHVVFDGREVDTTVNFGGCEQVTPPMMAPRDFDELVVPYDGQIIDYLKSRGIPVNMHCHGKIRYALRCMREMGVDSTDPVEPPPAGDVTFCEAQEIADGRVTLIGNLEWNEFRYLDPTGIRDRVHEIFSNGNRRIILAASAGPNTSITQHEADNIKAFVDAGLEFGGLP